MQNEKTEKTKWARRSLIIAIVGVAAGCMYITSLFFIATMSHSDDTDTVPIVRINGVDVTVDIATSSQKMKKGLCCRNHLPSDAGMLFMYEQPGDYGFWMKDTHIALDMFWIDTHKTIVHIEDSVKPDSYPRTFRSPVPAIYILETNAGFARKHGIQIGDVVEFIGI